MSIHLRDLQLLLIEIYKAINNWNPSFMAQVFVTNVVPYNLRGSTNLVLPKARTNVYGIETVRLKVIADSAERNQRVLNIGDLRKEY